MGEIGYLNVRMLQHSHFLCSVQIMINTAEHFSLPILLCAKEGKFFYGSFSINSIYNFFMIITEVIFSQQLKAYFETVISSIWG